MKEGGAIGGELAVMQVIKASSRPRVRQVYEGVGWQQDNRKNASKSRASRQNIARK